MKEILYRNKDYVVYLFVSLVAVTWNVLTMECSIPWCDETMLADTPANMYLYGKWETTAFYTMGEGSKPFSVYLPLYTWLLYAWISILGFSFIKVRLCELLTTVLLGASLLCLGKQAYHKFSTWAVFLFSLGFWFTDIMVNTYRQARPDILGALMCILFAIYAVKSIKGQNRHASFLILYSALTIAAGIQSAVYLVLGLVFAAFFVRPVKQLLWPVVCCIIGFVIGMAASFIYMAYFGEGEAFIVSIMNSSGSMMRLWGIARSIIFPLLGKEVTPLAYPEPSNLSFGEKLTEIFGYASAVILFASNVFLLVVNQVWKHLKECKSQLILVSFSLFVILGYNLAGRYQGYYMWTAVLPMLLALLIWVDSNMKRNVIVVAIATLCITFSALRRYPLSGETPCDRINAFVENQHFKKDEIIAAPFSTFYALKPTNPFTYFYQVYPHGLIGDVDYIIIPEYEGEYNQAGMEKYLKEYLTNPKYKVTKISTTKNPDLALYKVTCHQP